jgi:uncharacterized protein
MEPAYPPTPDPLLDPAKVAALEAIVDAYESVAVAFSAGIDSTLVLKVCHDRLGDRGVGVLGVSASLPPGERELAWALAREIGAPLVEVDTHELDDPSYAANPTDRCYYCKSELYRHVLPFAKEHGLAVVADGLNTDDLYDVRPGNQAAAESGVRHPLVEAGFDKADVRAHARALGLSNWDKPSLACLSSRVPHGTAIDAALLDRIGSAELRLRSLGLRQLRVRSHGEIARVEVAEEELAAAFAQREEVLRRVRESGFRFVTLDLQGYRTGSMHPPSAAP